jgi:sugar lactone lactonase YvrE
MSRGDWRVLGLVAAAVLGGCSHSTTAPGAKAIGVWVSNLTGSTLLGFTPSQVASSTTTATPVVLTTGNGNGAVAIDKSGNLWVADPFANSVAGYTPSQLGQTGSPSATVRVSADASGSLVQPLAMAFDAAGDLWVANAAVEGNGANTIVEFTPGQLASSGTPTPAVTLHDNAGSINGARGVTFDPGGNLWVSNSATVVEFASSQLAASGSPVPAVTLHDDGSGSISGPEGVAFDATGNLWVADFVANTVVGFSSGQLATSGSPTPAVTLTSSDASALNNPCGLAFDGKGNLWVANQTGQGLLEYTADELTSSGSPTPPVLIRGTAFAGPCALVFTP